MDFTFFCIVFSAIFSSIILIPSLISVNASESVLSSYLVHTDIHLRPPQFLIQDQWYSSMIESFTNRKIKLKTGSRIFYTYNEVLQGFAAKLTPQEAESINELPGVTGVFEDRFRINLDTTRSPDFLGLNLHYGLWPETDLGENIIIGVVDSGIWPESESFNDERLGPIPSKWKGTCEEGSEFNSSNCNRKLIGARFFFKGAEQHISSDHRLDFEYRSPRDANGHGTHTSSTAAGSNVKNANIFGFAKGQARGIASKARIAMYKACWIGGCADSDIVASIESAIKDGVDVLSLSFGSADEDYYENSIAIGTFAAVKRNIFVSCSGGNLGPHQFSVHNTAPWVITVGSGSLDRTFPVRIQLGNNKSFVGSSLYAGKINRKFSPLVYLKNCINRELVPRKVIGRIAVCYGSRSRAFDYGLSVKAAGGMGLIQLNDASEGEALRAIPYTLPAVTLGYKAAKELVSYIHSTKDPMARFRTRALTLVGKDRAPIVLSSSGRGPNYIVPEILKPDLVAPGLNILAAWPSNIAPTRSSEDPRRVKFNVDSGTSMACPHVAGVAALLRAAHPEWSAAAIRSALMTTATTIDNVQHPIAKFEDMVTATAISIGAGHVNPLSASDPGLIYDAHAPDYLKFLCSLNYTQKQMKIFTNKTKPCSGLTGSPYDLNYPSVSVVFRPGNTVHELRRTLTHVGSFLPEIYRVRIVNPNAQKVTVSVKPHMLKFGASLEKKSFRLKFETSYVFHSNMSILEQMVCGSISWESGKHIVRSPFSVMWDKNKMKH
ncbi:Subtilisin-like protease SBT1.7 [Forsythia ovata]|uniref:Subtilisin-like protease SBT1.7 n=1 Tax=Forsythia ovata TaxID=205694 RepID=A0ABD1U962_9LAMI